ncbi:ligase-associated DNA damage response exonuclease [Pseudorhodobacter sp. MZDSW-24AT]|uniref:ligase-associated DNA damage response exonuclease n=1 Tax=Pseudorhodobacter sp. MZDSW-24AT TaxID=2052957 RepID=UPI000C1DD423|nr:ligase-associated DNA damage response exonuclease [Pseudorhodobacter sp. MZDSW-24AT]PJF08321.1 DNA ligase-associated DEXH box helicase [Pseudorhodobacter sp. MZDSW-24AT]
MSAQLLSFTDRGIFCAEGGFYIDPWHPVDRALITHGHSDHARWGHGHYLCTHQALPVMRHRLGDIRAEGIGYGERRQIGGVEVSFHPAGHVPGSAQIRVARGGEVWVVSGDYKVEADGLSEPFEPVACHSFISECTFGLPLFRWQPQAVIAEQLANWWHTNAAEGRASILAAYGLGKAQRLMTLLPQAGPILTHGAVEETTRILRDQGYPLPATTRVVAGMDAKSHPGALIIAPPSALGTAWARRFGPSAEAFASGWMALRGIRRRRGLGTGFVISDHADWPGLNAAIRATGAERVFVTHGYTTPFRRWLEEQGYEAGIVQTEFGGEEADTPSEAEPS